MCKVKYAVTVKEIMPHGPVYVGRGASWLPIPAINCSTPSHAGPYSGLTRKSEVSIIMVLNTALAEFFCCHVRSIDPLCGVIEFTFLLLCRPTQRKSKPCDPVAPSIATRKKSATRCSPNTTSLIPTIWCSSNTKRFELSMSMVVQLLRHPRILASRDPLFTRRRRTSDRRDLGGFCPKSVVRKKHANSRRKSASIWRSLLSQSPILKPLRLPQESEDASALLSIPAP